MALFTNSEELKLANSAFTASFELENIQSFLSEAEAKHITPAIGSDCLNALISGKSADKTTKGELIQLLQKACLSFAMANYSAFGAVQIQDSGITVAYQDHARPASEAKIAQLRKQSLTDGFSFLELAIDFLEAHLGDFKEYAQSRARINNRALFINSSKEFTAACLPINAQLFNAMRSEILSVERDSILPIIGEELANTLHEKIQLNQLKNSDLSLLTSIQRALAPLALAGLIPYQMVKVDRIGGFQINNDEDSGASSEQILQTAMMRLTMRGESELVNLKNRLQQPKKASSVGHSKSSVVLL